MVRVFVSRVSNTKRAKGWSGDEECYLCGEFHTVALRNVDGMYVCVDCINEAGSKKRGNCVWCGKEAWLVEHHVHGRKHSEAVELICQNEHARAHPHGR